MFGDLIESEEMFDVRIVAGQQIQDVHGGGGSGSGSSGEEGFSRRCCIM